MSFAPGSGAAVINLVHQAAELFTNMEDRARDTETRAQLLCKNALERLELAEKRIQTAERERREAINEAHQKVRDACKALLTAVEFRAQAAEAEAREAKEALALVEEAIRSRLLSARPDDGGTGQALGAFPRVLKV